VNVPLGANSLTVSCLTEEGVPVQGVAVFVQTAHRKDTALPCLSHDQLKDRRCFLVSQYTDADGLLVVYGIPEGTYRVSVRHPLVAAAVRNVSVGTGRQVEESVTMVAGTPVDISATFGDFRVRDFSAAVCDTTGGVIAAVNSYEFGTERSELPVALLPGVYRITVVGPYLAATSKVVEVGSRRLAAPFTLDQGGWIEINGAIADPRDCRLSDADGRELRLPDHCPHYVADPEGEGYSSLLVGHLPAGSYSLATGEKSEPKKLKVGAGAITSVDP
jgi:hypothetical protein